MVQLDQRVPEPELMEDSEQARAYSEADFARAHDGLIHDLVSRHGHLRPGDGLRVVDLGCGAADVTVRLARALPAATVVGIDAGPVMLGLGLDRVAREGLEARITLVQARADGNLAGLVGPAGLVVSNSLLHHLADPAELWAAVRVVAAPGAVVHVSDLRRPADTAAVVALVGQYAAGAPPVLVKDFRNSLMAAYRVEEVEAQLREHGLDGHLVVHVVSDRHLVVCGRLEE